LIGREKAEKFTQNKKIGPRKRGKHKAAATRGEDTDTGKPRKRTENIYGREDRERTDRHSKKARQRSQAIFKQKTGTTNGGTNTGQEKTTTRVLNSSKLGNLYPGRRKNIIDI